MFPAALTLSPTNLETPSSTKTIRVLVVDRSAYTRFTLSKSLRQTNDITIAGLAQNGEEALTLIPSVRPDVITLDAQAPHHEGISTLRTIMARYPIPVVILSNLNRDSARETVEALTSGAIDFVAKPSARTNVGTVIVELIAKIRNAANAKVTPSNTVEPANPDHPIKRPRALRKQDKVVVIGTSIGGPRALRHLLTNVPLEAPASFIIVQHLQNGFTESLAKQLDDVSNLVVKEAQNGEVLRAGVALFAPSGWHLGVDENHTVVLNKSPLVNGARPSVDVTMNAVARRYGEAAIGVILTGTGTDGLSGCVAIRKMGGQVVVEDHESATMAETPKQIISSGQATAVVPLTEIPPTLNNLFNTN